MARIRHTRDRERNYRFGGISDGIEFEIDEREIDVDDETAEWAVETFDDLEFADEDVDEDADEEDVRDPGEYSREELAEREYEDLQDLAMVVNDDRIDGNSPREEIVDVLSGDADE